MEEATLITEQYYKLINQCPQILTVPHIPQETIETILIQSNEIFQTENSLLILEGPAVIVGDLHGNVFDLYKIFLKHPPPPQMNYVFLGDLVDRGEHSLEIVEIIFSLKILFPENVFIIRGNHESEFISRKCGFYSEVEVKYHGSNIYNLCIQCFHNLPIALLLNKETLCVHGGISPRLKSIKQIADIKKPLLLKSNCSNNNSNNNNNNDNNNITNNMDNNNNNNNNDNDNDGNDNDNIIDENIAVKEDINLTNDLIWSDPCFDIPLFKESLRGIGCAYGEEALCNFLDENNLARLVRGHECINEGYRLSFNDRLITVFSASQYCGYQENLGAIMIFDNMEDLKSSYRFETFSIEQDIEKHVSFMPKPIHESKKYSGLRSCFNSSPFKLLGIPSNGPGQPAIIKKWNSDIEDKLQNRKIRSFELLNKQHRAINRKAQVASCQPTKRRTFIKCSFSENLKYNGGNFDVDLEV